MLQYNIITCNPSFYFIFYVQKYPNCKTDDIHLSSMLIIKIGDRIINSYLIFRWNSVREKKNKRKTDDITLLIYAIIKIKENTDDISLLLYSVIMVKKRKTDDINFLIYAIIMM